MSNRKSLSDDYIADICRALQWHRPCCSSGTHKAVENFLLVISGFGHRAPNDWQPEYTGAFTARWYDGQGDRLGAASKSIALTIAPREKGFEYSIRGNLTGKYSDSQTHIAGLNESQACLILGTLIELVEQKTKGDK